MSAKPLPPRRPDHRPSARAILVLALSGFAALLGDAPACPGAMIKVNLSYSAVLKGYQSAKLTTAGGAPAGAVTIDSLTKAGARLATLVNGQPYTSGTTYDFDAPGIPGADILRLIVGNDTFNPISRSGTYTSIQEAKKNAGNKQEESGAAPADHPFRASNSSFFTTTQLFDQFVLHNASPDTAYNISLLQIYTGLDRAFLNTPDFASPSAIATGTQVVDEAPADLTTFVPSGGGTLAFSIESGAGTNSYDLLVITAEPILSGDRLGTPFTFSLASYAVPEPSSMTLLLGGVGSVIAVLGARSARAFGRPRPG